MPISATSPARRTALGCALVLSIGLSACADDGPPLDPHAAERREGWSLSIEDWTSDYELSPWTTDAFAATDLRFLDDGRAILITKGGWGGPGNGEVRLISADGTTSEVLLTVPVCTDAERGLLGLEIDPGFEENQRIYLFYTRQMSDCALAGDLNDLDALQPVYNRLSAFRFDERGIDPASEEVLLDELPGHQSSHNAGGLGFFPDGSLLVSVGEAAYGRSREPDFVAGKLLRIDPSTGNGVADNPSFDANDPTSVRSRTYSLGLRNPFRFAIDSNGRVAVADVGTNDYEEVNLASPGDDFGFPDGEGPIEVEGGKPPALWYEHLDECNSIIGGDWVPPKWIPETDDEGFAFSDFGCGGVFVVFFESGAATRLAQVAPKIDHSLASVVYGPDNSLYLVGVGPGEFPVLRLAPRPPGIG